MILYVLMGLAAVVGLALAVVLLLSAGLIVVLLLQAAGVMRRVPFSYNLRNLVVRWRVTLLTGLAFTLVVGLMVVMLAFVRGMYELTGNSGRPDNVIVLADGAIDELISNLSYGDITAIDHFSPLIAKDDEGKPLVSHELYLVVNQPIRRSADPKVEEAVPVEKGKPGERQRRFIQVRGLDDLPRAAAVHRLKLKAGEWFDKPSRELSGEPLGALNVVLGEGIARELGKDQGKATLVVGDLFALGSRKWSVAGILDSAGSTFDSEVWTGRGTAGQTFGKPEGRTTVVIQAVSADKARELAADLVQNYKKPAVLAQVEPDYYNKLTATNDMFLGAIIFVAVFLALGGIVGIMNTMYAAISQRTKDIGVLRILGYSRFQVLTSFFLESLLLALIGGAMGCAAGFLANGYSATSILSGGMGGGKSVVLKLVVDWQILAVGMAFSLIMGCVGGLIPALSAMRLRPLESLR
jgi:ABC-type lipoprotein release transport system permease subunit